MKTVAIIPAGGSGKRMQEYLSKQYLLLDGIPVLVHTLRIFQKSPEIHEVFLIVPENDIAFALQHIVEKNGISKVSRILKGGRERQDSVRSGINALEDEHHIVIIHDGVRPFITEEILHAVISEAFKERAVTVGVPVKDTVKTVDDNGWVAETLDRNRLWLIQTPQAFTRDIIQKAYEDAYKDHYYGTDDASLVERIGINVKVIHGSYDNIKITTKNDLVLAEVLIKRLKKGMQ
ncbi:MAG TPA: 2-C-methyl-D-erythritol 4-phosphate cytidylyltransferase [Syntrophaceae bacterium]|jgi:2-C-methyl-D-erythritol 4-phosphate cytidylyltransferase|nr:2-C-methyl-D-erythritol 4-phosphate cytidylyltransferase [Syntrophaceae bacterium]